MKKKENTYNLLELIPFRNYNFEFRDNNLVDVLVPRFTDKFFGKFLQPRLKRPYIRANLDSLGTEVWLLIDGKKSVNEIIELMKSKYFDSENNIEDRVILFINNLHKYNFIKFFQIKKEF